MNCGAARLAIGHWTVRLRTPSHPGRAKRNECEIRVPSERERPPTACAAPQERPTKAPEADHRCPLSRIVASFNANARRCSGVPGCGFDRFGLLNVLRISARNSRSSSRTVSAGAFSNVGVRAFVIGAVIVSARTNGNARRSQISEQRSSSLRALSFYVCAASALRFFSSLTGGEPLSQGHRTNSPGVFARSRSHALCVRAGLTVWSRPVAFGPTRRQEKARAVGCYFPRPVVSLPRGIGLQPFGLPLTCDPAPQ